MRLSLGLVIAVALAAAAAPASADVTWLCRPGLSVNPCVGNLQYTDARSGDVHNPRVAAAPKIDCFYVYPTVSNEPGPNASKLAGPEIQAIATYQAQQFSRICRVFSPVYRQITVLTRGLNLANSVANAAPLAYADVREAFLAYLKTDNRGRGFVLVGHSQGATMLRALIRQEVDPRPRIRRRLVSAILPGANVLVRRGMDTGGDFAHVPACRGRGQSGCVAAWSTFDYVPPGDAKFGRPQDGGAPAALGLPSGPEYEVLCTNPAVLSDTNRDRLVSLVPSSVLFPGLIGVFLLQTYGGMPPLAATPWVRPPDRYSAQCATDADANVLHITPVGDARRLLPAPDDTWGQHLVDLNLPLGNVLSAVRAQKTGFRAVRLRVHRRGRSTVVTIVTAPRSKVRLTQRLGAKVIARRTVSVTSGVKRVRLPAKRLRHYAYTAKRLN
jgi:hypothetical protein